MRRYITYSAVAFGFFALLHLVRLLAEDLRPLRDPMFLGYWLLYSAFVIWGWRLLSRARAAERVVRAYPMLPRYEAEIRRLAHDLTVPRANDKDDFYRRMGVARETWHLQETSLGHWVIVVTDMADKRVDDAARIYAASPKDSDRWFKEQVMLITGLDPTITPLGPPTEALFDSSTKS